MSIAGSSSSRGTHSRSPSRSRSPPYSDGRYPQRYGSRYDSSSYRPGRSAMSAAFDDYRDLRDRDRDRIRDRERPMPMMRGEDRYFARGRESRYSPYYRDGLPPPSPSQSNYPPPSSSTVIARDYPKASSSPLRREAGSIDRVKPPPLDMKASASSLPKEIKEDPKPSSSQDKPRYMDWRDRDRDRDRDRRLRDDDRRREFERRPHERDSYLVRDPRYDVAPYTAPLPSSSAPYAMPSFAGDSYRPDSRDRPDDRDLYRLPPRGAPGEADRYRGRSFRPGDRIWGSSVSGRTESRGREREREREREPSARSPRSTSITSRPSTSTPIAPIPKEDSSGDSRSDDTLQRPIVAASPLESSGVVLAQTEERSIQNTETSKTPEPKVTISDKDTPMTNEPPTATAPPPPVTGKSNNVPELPVRSSPHLQTVENKEQQPVKREDIAAAPLNQLVMTKVEPVATQQREIQKEPALEPKAVDVKLPENKEETRFEQASPAIVSGPVNPAPSSGIFAEESKENIEPRADKEADDMTKQQIVERIDQIENDISMYEEMLNGLNKNKENATSLTDSTTSHTVEKESRVEEEEDDDDDEEEDDDDADSSARAEEEAAKQKALEMISEGSKSLTEIQNFSLKESPIMRRRPQLLINQVRTHDDTDDLLCDRILRDNRRLAKENSRMINEWQGAPDTEAAWADEENWSKPLYQRPADYPCVKKNKADFVKLRPIIASCLAARDRKLAKKERALKRKYKELYDQWKEKNLALDRIRDHERGVSEKYSQRSSSSRRRVEEEPEEYVDGVIFTGDHDALLFRQSDGTSTPFDPGKGPWTSDTVRSEAELLEIIQSLESAEMRNPELRAAKTTAAIPRMILDANERKRTYDDRSGLVDDPLTYYHTGPDTEDVWNQEEMTLFMESYVKFPKQFDKIAAAVKTKTASQCVLFYYRKKSKIDFKALMRNGRREKTKRRGLAAAVRRAAGGSAPTTRRGKNKGSALMADIGKAQTSRKAKEESETKTREPKDSDDMLWESAPDRRRGKARLSSSALNLAGTPGSSASEDVDMARDKRRVPRRKGRSPRISTALENNAMLSGDGVVDDEAMVPPRERPTPTTTGVPRRQRARTTSGKLDTEEPSDLADGDYSARPQSQPTARRGGRTSSLSETKRPATSSYWSVQEKADVVRYLAMYGTDFEKVAAAMKTKSAIQVRNFYGNPEKMKQADIPPSRPSSQERGLPPMGTAFDDASPTTPSQTSPFHTMPNYSFASPIPKHPPHRQPPPSQPLPPQPQPQPPARHGTPPSHTAHHAAYMHRNPPPHLGRIDTFQSSYTNYPTTPSASLPYEASPVAPTYSHMMPHQRPHGSRSHSLPTTSEPPPSAVTKVSDLLNSEDPAESNQKNWESWFGS